MSNELIAFLLAVPVVITATVVGLGIRQARSLRDITGDKGFMGSLLGMTWQPPSPPNPEHLKLHEPIRLFPFAKKRKASTPSRRTEV